MTGAELLIGGGMTRRLCSSAVAACAWRFVLSNKLVRRRDVHLDLAQSDVPYSVHRSQLTRGRLPTQLLEQWLQRVEFGAKAGPVPGL